MSFFKTQWIVLQVWKISEKENYYKIFFADYGILTVTKKKKVREKPIDAGYYIQCEIITQNNRNIHIISNIKILWYFESNNKTYTNIHIFLRIIAYTLREIAPWNPQREVFWLLSQLIEKQNEITTIQLILTHLKLQSVLWNLKIEHSDITCQKILKFLQSHPYHDIFRLWTIPDDTQKKLEQLL